MSGCGRYTFGDFTLDVREHRLLRGGKPVTLAPKALDLLAVLVEHAGHLVTKNDLLDAVWPDAYVDEGILSVHVSGLRKALGDDRSSRVVIETVTRAGYRFMAPVAASDRPSNGGPVAAMAPQRPADALRLFGRGRGHLLSASMFELPAAVAAFEAAVDLDPTYAAALAGLALACCAQATLRAVPHADAYSRAKAAALRALAMDPDCADAQTALGVVLMLSEWDWHGAARSLDRALELAPHHTQAVLHRGQLLEAMGDLPGGLAMKQTALEHDPDAPLVLLQVSLSYWNQHRFDDALEWATRALAVDPKLLLAREHVAAVCWQRGDFARMMVENVTQAESFGAPPSAIDRIRSLGEQVVRASETGGRLAAMRLLHQFALQQTQAAAAVQLAILSGEVGALDAAFDYLERAIDARDPALVHLAVAPQWDPLRHDPRFTRCLGRMGLPSAISH